MTWKLTIGAYNAMLPSSWEDITPIVRNLVLRSVLPGGLQDIEFDIADDYVDSYRWAYDHIGASFYVFDNAVNPPVAEGVLFESGISESGNRVTIAGPWQAHCFSQVYNNTATWVAAGQTGAQIRAMLTNECPGVNTNQDNVDEPGTNNFPWQPTDNAYPGDLIPGLVALSDAANAEWYFWLQSAPMSGISPTAPIPWFKAATDVPGLYTCWREDMAPGGLNLTPSIRELVNDARVIYRDAAGTQNQTPSGTDADSQARYGLRERWDFDLGVATGAAARQYRAVLKQKYKGPQQSANFQLNTWAYDQWGGRWPLWRVIAAFPVKFTVMDLLPDTTVLGHTLDNKRTFITLAAEYHYDTNSLTITPDTEDNRADAMLARHRTFQ